jgi:hypothetical protein
MAHTEALPLSVGYTSDSPYSLKEFRMIHLLAQDLSLHFSSSVNIFTEDEVSDLVDADEWELLWWGQDVSDVNTLWQRDGYLLVANSYESNQSVYVKVFARTLQDAQTSITEFQEKANPVEITSNGTVNVKFWSVGNNGVEALARDIEVEDWPDVEENYAKGARQGISRLMSMRPPFEGGRIVLWHGPPGTGKSHAIRALIKTWEPWCDANYIVDPDVVFSRAATLMDLLIGRRSYGLVSTSSYPDDAFVLHGSDRWRLFIMEDTDEFLKADAKERRGQAMSRLLNTADGFIGQGLKVLFLITTNEPMHAIHQAVSRPGRCIANTEVGTFNQEEARRWLANHGMPTYEFPTYENVSLADCYDALRSNRQIKREIEVPQQVGQYL